MQGTTRRTARLDIKVLGALTISGKTLVVLVGLASCRDVLAPCGSSETVVVSDSDATGVRFVDPSGRCPVRQVVAGGRIEGMTATGDGTTLFLGVKSTDFRRSLVAIRVADEEIEWRETLSDSSGPRVVDGVGLISGEAVGISIDNSLIYLWRGASSGTEGITALDIASRRPLGFSGPWNVAAGGLVPLAPNPRIPSGALAVVGEPRPPGARRASAVYLLDPGTLEVMDSITAAALNETDIWQVIRAADDRTIYVAGDSRILRYDMIDRQVTATAQRPGTGVLVLMPGGTTLVVTDGGVWPDSPGSGLLWLFEANLTFRGTIDVSTPLGGTPGGPTATVTGSAAPGRDGRTLFVRTGSEAVGPLYPPQRARLLVIDIENRTVDRVIELGGYGLGYLFLGPQ